MTESLASISTLISSLFTGCSDTSRKSEKEIEKNIRILERKNSTKAERISAAKYFVNLGIGKLSDYEVSILHRALRYKEAPIRKLAAIALTLVRKPRIPYVETLGDLPRSCTGGSNWIGATIRWGVNDYANVRTYEFGIGRDKPIIVVYTGKTLYDRATGRPYIEMTSPYYRVTKDSSKEELGNALNLAKKVSTSIDNGTAHIGDEVEGGSLGGVQTTIDILEKWYNQSTD